MDANGSYLLAQYNAHNTIEQPRITDREIALPLGQRDYPSPYRHGWIDMVHQMSSYLDRTRSVTISANL